LNEIKKILSGIRQSKKNSVNGNNDSFTKYFSQIEELFSINTKVDLLIPSLEEFKEKRNKEEEAKNKKEKRKKRNEFLFNAIIVGVLSAVVSGLLVYFATTYFGNHKNEQKPNNSAVIDTAKKY
jgi:cytoskeletal protein RodZ